MATANRNGVLSPKLEMCALFLAILGTQTNISSAFNLHNVNVGVGQIQSPYSSTTERYRHICESPTVRLSATNDSSEEDSEGANEEDGLGFTALPAIGASSFWDRSEDEQAYANANAYKISSSNLASQPNDNEQSNNSNINSNGIIISEHTNLVSRKFKIQYTCKVCDTRNSHSVTRLAYRNGVVIAQCKGCYSRHLIADNLGWSNYIGGFDVDNGETDIEMYMENRDQEARQGGVIGDDDYEEGKNDLVMRVGQDVFDLENILYKGQQGSAVSTEGAGKGDEAEDESSWS